MSEIEVVARCRVAGLQDLPEDATCDLMELAANEVERRVPQIGPVIAIHGDELTARGSFEIVAGRNPFDDAEAYAHQLSAALRVALQARSIAEVTITARELVPA